MQLLTFSTLLLLISTSYGDDSTTLSTGLVYNPFATSVIIDMPSSCKYSGMTATLNVYGPGNQTVTSGTFTVPQCRLKRGLIVVSDPQNGNTQTINVGYQVTGLSPDTQYIAAYTIGGTTFNQTQFTTKTVSQVPSTFRRSGGMVVITVLLSISMFLLLVGLIVVLVLGGRGTK